MSQVHDPSPKRARSQGERAPAARRGAAEADRSPAAGPPPERTIQLGARTGLLLLALLVVLTTVAAGAWLNNAPSGIALRARLQDWPIPEPAAADWVEFDPDVRAAITAARSAIAAQPTSAEAWRKLGMIYDAHNLWALATPAYARALALDPDDGRTAYYVAHSTDRMEATIEETQRAYEQAIALAPDYGPVHIRLAEALQRVGRHLEARAAFERAIATYPEASSARARRGLGRTLLALGDAAGAAAQLEAAIRIRGDDASTWNALSQAYNQLDRGAEARQAADRGARMTETLGYFDDWRLAVLEEAVSPALVDRRIAEKLEMGRPNDALADALRYEQRHPDWPSIKRIIGNLYRAGGRDDLAQPYFDAAMELVRQGHTR